MKLIWDTQNDEPMFAINRNALTKRIRDKGRSVYKSIAKFEWILIVAAVFAAGFIIVDAIIEQDSWRQYAAGASFLLVAFYMLALRRFRFQSDEQFEPSVLGDIDRALFQLKQHVSRLRSFFWWYWLPFSGVMLLSVMVSGDNVLRKALLILALQAAALLLTRWEVNKEIRCHHEPQRKELEALRKLIVEADSG